MADDMLEAEQHMALQEQWGLSRSDMVLVRLVRMMRLARTRLVALDDRVTALEARVTALEGK